MGLFKKLKPSLGKPSASSSSSSPSTSLPVSPNLDNDDYPNDADILRPARPAFHPRFRSSSSASSSRTSLVENGNSSVKSIPYASLAPRVDPATHNNNIAAAAPLPHALSPSHDAFPRSTRSPRPRPLLQFDASDPASRPLPTTPHDTSSPLARQMSGTSAADGEGGAKKRRTFFGMMGKSKSKSNLADDAQRKERQQQSEAIEQYVENRRFAQQKPPPVEASATSSLSQPTPSSFPLLAPPIIKTPTRLSAFDPFGEIDSRLDEVLRSPDEMPPRSSPSQAVERSRPLPEPPVTAPDNVEPSPAPTTAPALSPSRSTTNTSSPATFGSDPQLPSEAAAPTAAAPTSSSNASSSSFPWSLPRSKSPTPSALFGRVKSKDGTTQLAPTTSGSGINPTEQVANADKSPKETTTGLGLMRLRPKPTPVAKQDDDGFRVRSFRHVSSGSGIPPWEVQFDGANGEARTTTSSPPLVSVDLDAPAPTARPANHQRHSSNSGIPLSRPTSMADDGDISPRQVSVQRFKQTRRFSSMDLPAAQESLAQQQEQAKESMEVLLPAPGQSSDSADGMSSPTTETGSKAAFFPAEMRRSPPSETTTRPGHSRSSSGFVVRNRRTLSVASTEAMGFRDVSASDDGHRSMSILGGDIAASPTTDNADAMVLTARQTRQSPRPASVVGFAGPSPYTAAPSTSPGSRTSLSSRLAGLAVATRSTPLDPIGCEIPPVTSPSSPSSTVTAVPSQAHTELPPVTALPPPARPPSVRPASSSRPPSVVSSSPATRAKDLDGWASSSEDESSSKKVRVKRAALPPAKPFAAKPRTESMPSGLRRPPPPSIAFKDATPVKDPRKPSGTRSASSNDLLSIQHASKPTFQNRRSVAAQEAVSSESETEESSDNESLAAIRTRGSSNSLSSHYRSGVTTPPVRPPPSMLHSAPVSPRRERKPILAEAASKPRPIAPQRQAPAAAAPRPHSTTPSYRSPSQMTFVPPLLPPAPLATASLRPRESPASSQSGATGDTATSGMPMTPKDTDLTIAEPRIRRNERASSNDAASAAGARARRVSFAQAGWSADTSTDEDAQREHARKERRREEAMKANEVSFTFFFFSARLDLCLRLSQIGNINNATRAPPKEAHALPTPPAFMPFMAGGGSPGMMSPQQWQQMYAAQMWQMGQMANLNDPMAYMHAHQQA